MYQPSTPPVVPHTGRTALIYGVIVGLGLGILESGILVYLTRHMYYGSLTLLSIPFSLLLWIIALLVVGALASRRTGKINTGTLAGLWAGMAGGTITAVTWFVVLMSSISYYYSYSSIAATYLTALILLILAALGVGTGLGALGGLIGQSFSTSTHIPPASYRSQQSDPPQPSRRSDPPQQEILQYQQSNASQRDQQAE